MLELTFTVHGHGHRKVPQLENLDVCQNNKGEVACVEVLILSCTTAILALRIAAWQCLVLGMFWPSCETLAPRMAPSSCTAAHMAMGNQYAVQKSSSGNSTQTNATRHTHQWAHIKGRSPGDRILPGHLNVDLAARLPRFGGTPRYGKGVLGVSLETLHSQVNEHGLPFSH
jgi:hypothetical protein